MMQGRRKLKGLLHPELEHNLTLKIVEHYIDVITDGDIKY